MTQTEKKSCPEAYVEVVRKKRYFFGLPDVPTCPEISLYNAIYYCTQPSIRTTRRFQDSYRCPHSVRSRRCPQSLPSPLWRVRCPSLPLTLRWPPELPARAGFPLQSSTRPQRDTLEHHQHTEGFLVHVLDKMFSSLSIRNIL